MTKYQPTVPDGEKPVQGGALPSEDQDPEGEVEAGDHDDEDSSNEPDTAGEMEALGRALIDAILSHASPEDVRKLLDEDDAPLWYQDEDGWSALHAAASVEDAELVKGLLQRGAPWNSGEARSRLLCALHVSLISKIAAGAAAPAPASASGQHREYCGRRGAFSE
jgi:hypothetical protein